MNIAASLARSAADNPDRVAIRLGDQTTSYRELDDQSARVAGLLAARGIAPGTPIGIMLPNVPEFASVYYGVLRAGGVVVPMNPLLKAREIAYYLGDSGAPVIFAWHVAAPEVEIGAKEGGAEAILVDPASFPDILATATPAPQVVDRAADDTAVILYTSGTTGQPKGAELTHSNLINNVEVRRRNLPGRSGRRHLRRAAAVPLIRADVHTQRCDHDGRLADGAAALRRRLRHWGCWPTNGSPYSLVSRPCSARFFTCRTAQTTTSRRCACACLAVRRCRSRCCASSRTRSTASCSRDTACRRRRR